MLSQNSQGLPPSPEGHFAAGSLSFRWLRVAGKLMRPTNEGGERGARQEGGKKRQAADKLPIFDLKC